MTKFRLLLIRGWCGPVFDASESLLLIENIIFIPSLFSNKNSKMMGPKMAKIYNIFDIEEGDEMSSNS